MLDNHAQSRVVGCAAMLAGMMAIATGAAAGENNASLAEKRGLFPIIAQAATPGATPQPDYILKDCQETETTGDPRSAMRSVDPAGSLAVYIGNRDNRSIYSDSAAMASIKITLLEDTKHGELTTEVDNTGLTFYGYDPEPDYVGKDRAVFMAEFEGKRYKIVLELRVFTVVDENNPTCPEPKLIKVKKTSTGSSSYDLNSVTFAHLDGSAVGQTVGTTITLDANAAGPAPYLIRRRTAGFHA